MSAAKLIVFALGSVLVIAAPAGPVVTRVGDTAFIQLEAPSFSQLTAKQQALAYDLTQASIAIDPIIYDQLSRFGVREKRVLEGIVAYGELAAPIGGRAGVDVPPAIAPQTFARIRDYALLFWANRGNHNEITAQKFLPEFNAADLTAAALRAQANGAFRTPYADLPALTSPDALKKELS